MLDKVKFMSWFNFINEVKARFQGLFYKLFWKTLIKPKSVILITLI